MSGHERSQGGNRRQKDDGSEINEGIGAVPSASCTPLPMAEFVNETDGNTSSRCDASTRPAARPLAASTKP